MVNKEILLKLQNVSVHYGGVKALDDVSLAIDENEIVGVMGPNGAGKSTALKAIFGLAPINQGRILWHERPIAPLAFEMSALGIAFVPQGRRVFKHLTVDENLEIGGFAIKNKNEIRRRAQELMETFPILKAKKHLKSGALSGGQQQMLALARGLMAEPKVLLLDEPSLGLSPKMIKEIFGKIKEINERHKTAILIVEHNLKTLLGIVDKAYVLDKGRVIASGAGREIINSNILEEVFLGKN